MNIEEANHVLAVAASYDNRPPSQATATTWAYDLAAISRDDAVAAVREHYRQHPGEWIEPGHVLEIVKRARSVGLAHSSRIENAAVEALDPDDPAYDAKYMRAIQAARARAGDDAGSIPERIAIGGRIPDPDEWAERSRRGNELIRAVLAEATPFRQEITKTDVPANLQRAREAAAEHKAARRRTDPQRLGRAGAAVLRQLNPERKAST